MKFGLCVETGAAPIARGGRSIRVVPNKFPALGIEGELDKEGEGCFDKMMASAHTK